VRRDGSVVIVECVCVDDAWGISRLKDDLIDKRFYAMHAKAYNCMNLKIRRVYTKVIKR
jgi:hypothetical protein